MPTPPDPEQPHPGPVLEPVRVVRLRRFDALAELMREMLPERETFESFGTAPLPGAGAPRTSVTEDDTQELPPFPATRQTPRDGTGRSAPGLRRAAVAVAVGAAAVVGFGCALLLPTRQEADASPQPSHTTTTTPTATAPAAPAATPGTTPAADPDGAGTLRQGDTGPEVAELQQRLLRVPDVYRDGSTDATYDTVLTAAVARFQLWYGISGDETGVYGNDTRRALESRTSLDGGG
ncbi:peptidoglycan-binding protein [Streptomyces sp. NPDC059468]|uniref:peptidoglycan-binding protein n=1 Tax=Streptomyces sp. NPDC059468 TaxID=3346845 RepID=UPI00367FB208